MWSFSKLHGMQSEGIVVLEGWREVANTVSAEGEHSHHVILSVQLSARSPSWAALH